MDTVRDQGSTVADQPLPSTDRYRDRPFRRGYTAPASERAAIAAAHATKPWLSAAVALADQVIIAATVIAVAWPVLWQGWRIPVGLALACLGSVIVGRQFRALECLTHEGSHFNWSRLHRGANNLLVTVLASVPAGVSLNVYRSSHLRHHGRFGTRDDPDRANYERLGLENLDRSNALAFAIDSVGLTRRYLSRWRETARGSGIRPVIPAAWAAVVIVLPATALWWRPSAAIVSAGIWLLGYCIMLPVIRFLGESSEHIYTGQNTVFDSTISNLGMLQKLLIHPHGDGYHTIHHMWPGVPHHQIRRLHQRLVIGDPAGYAARLPHRTRFLSGPSRGIFDRRAVHPATSAYSAEENTHE